MRDHKTICVSGVEFYSSKFGIECLLFIMWIIFFRSKFPEGDEINCFFGIYVRLLKQSQIIIVLSRFD